MKTFVMAACAASLAFVAAADVASAAKARKPMGAESGTPFPGAQRSGDFGGSSREGTNEVETILGNNPMVKAPVRAGATKVSRIDSMPGNNPASGTAAAKKK